MWEDTGKNVIHLFIFLGPYILAIIFFMFGIWIRFDWIFSRWLTWVWCLPRLSEEPTMEKVSVTSLRMSPTKDPSTPENVPYWRSETHIHQQDEGLTLFSPKNILQCFWQMGIMIEISCAMLMTPTVSDAFIRETSNPFYSFLLFFKSSSYFRLRHNPCIPPNPAHMSGVVCAI